jgi:hypothetical protein
MACYSAREKDGLNEFQADISKINARDSLDRSAFSLRSGR